MDDKENISSNYANTTQKVNLSTILDDPSIGDEFDLLGNPIDNSITVNDTFSSISPMSKNGKQLFEALRSKSQQHIKPWTNDNINAHTSKPSAPFQLRKTPGRREKMRKRKSIIKGIIGTNLIASKEDFVCGSNFSFDQVYISQTNASSRRDTMDMFERQFGDVLRKGADDIDMLTSIKDEDI